MGEKQYALVKPVSTGYEETIGLVKEALKAQGFGVLSEIDIAKALKERIGVDYPPTVILGACNPRFAHATLSVEPDISVLLPCNVVVRETQDGKVEVAAIDPDSMAGQIGNPKVNEIAADVTRLIKAALDTLR